MICGKQHPIDKSWTCPLPTGHPLPHQPRPIKHDWDAVDLDDPCGEEDERLERLDHLLD